MVKTNKDKVGAFKKNELSVDENINSFSCHEDIFLPLYRKFGARFIQYRNDWRRISEYKLETRFPLFLVFELMSKCNYNCAMCFRGKFKLRKKYEYADRLNYKMYKRLIDEAAQFACPSISLNNNNEPLLQEDLERYIKYASKREIMDIMINTNASLLTEARAKALLDSGLTRIMFSLDALTGNTYSSIRRKNNFGKVKNNILNFIELKKRLNRKLPLVRITFVRTSINAAEEKQFLDFWKDKCDYISFQEFLPPYFYGYGHLRVRHLTKNSPFSCFSPWQRLVICGDGSVLPCCQHFARELRLGSIHENSLMNIWNSDELKKLRESLQRNSFTKDSVCYKCKMSYEGINIK